MLPSITNDLLYILSILESIGKIEKYTKNYGDAEFFFEANDQLPFNASLSLLINIGETCSKLSDELKEKYTNIPWVVMKNFRNRIAHDYVNLDFFIVFDIIKEKLPAVKIEIEKLLIEELKKKTFAFDEYEVCIGNKYYKNVDFEKISFEISNTK